MQAKIKAYIEAQEQTLCAAIARLVAIPSVKDEARLGMPFGKHCAAVLDEALAIAAQWGLPGENLEGYVGTVDLGSGPLDLHILAHLDVVPAGPSWSVTSAFAAKRVGDLLFGRGVSDDKGPALAALLALRAVQDLGIPLRKRVRLILGTDEESGFHDIAWYYARYPHAPNTFSPDAHFPVTNLEKGHLQPQLKRDFAEPVGGARILCIQTDNPVNMVPPAAKAQVCGITQAQAQAQLAALPLLSHDTRLCFTLRAQGDVLHILVQGQAAHASTPEEGCNALSALLTFLAALPLAAGAARDTLHALVRFFPHEEHTGAALGIAQSDELSGPLTLTLSVMDWTQTGMQARFDARTPLCASSATTLEAAQTALAACDIALQGQLTPAHYVPADTPFVQTLLRCYEQYSGNKGACLSMGGGTYVHGIPGGVAFGACMPGFSSHLHEADECVSVSELLCAAQIFTQVIIELCS